MGLAKPKPGRGDGGHGDLEGTDHPPQADPPAAGDPDRDEDPVPGRCRAGTSGASPSCTTWRMSGLSLTRASGPDNDVHRADEDREGAEEVVIVADTNVWARAFLGDDPHQSPRARRALAAARSKEGVFIPLVVMAELSWVLRGARWDRDRVLRTLDSLLQTRGVTPEAPQLVRTAVDATKKGGRGRIRGSPDRPGGIRQRLSRGHHFRCPVRKGREGAKAPLTRLAVGLRAPQQALASGPSPGRPRTRGRGRGSRCRSRRTCR